MKGKIASWLVVVLPVLTVILIFLPLLTPPSNCGGNSYALSACKQYALITRLATDDGKTGISNLAATEKLEAARLSKNGWDFLVRTNFTSRNMAPVIAIVCEKPFSNIPQPTFWNLYRENPAYAVGYSDGSTSLISLAEFAALDLTSFIPLSSLTTNSLTRIFQP